MTWRMPVGLLALALIAVACSTLASNGDHHADDGTGLPVVTFTTASGAVVPIAVEVADTAELRTCGLMHRRSLPEEQGMLFVFEQDGMAGFWMRNTLIPLSIAYIAADGRIVDILEMQRLPDPSSSPAVSYTPRAPYRYAIEANSGWYARHGIAVGDVADVTAAVETGSAGQPPPLCRQFGT